jgi:hypothetical protein
MLRRSIVIYILIAMITVLHITSVLAKEKQRTTNPYGHQSAVQPENIGNTAKVTPFPVVIDPRNPDAVMSGSLSVDFIFSKPKQEPWIEYSLSATLYRWMLRKPGNYGSRCVTGSIKSNVDVLIDFIEFEDLQTPPLLKGLNRSIKCSDQQVEMYYSANIGEIPIHQVQWHRSFDFNNPENDLFIAANPNVDTYWSLWSMVSITPDIAACNFQDRAFISVKIANLKIWLDPELPTGGE